MTNLLRRVVTASVLSALVLSSAAPANASLKHRKHAAMARGHHAKLPVHHTKLPVRHALGASSIPTTPTNFVATAGDQQAAFSWTGTNGATRYVVMVRPNNASCVTVATVCAVRGLTNGTVYSATVVAVNNLGSSAPSVTRTVTPVASRPFAPRSVSAMAFGLHARVTWVPVTGLSNPVTSYTVTATPGGMTCQSATTTCVIGELTAGTTYTFTVTATNAVGTSPASSPSPSLTIVDRPDAPANIDVAPSPDSIGVSWDAPASNGGLAIDSYIATAYLESSGAPVAHCRVVTESCEIIGLSPATTYVVRVLAHNAIGYSVASATSEPVLTGYNAPGAPLDVTVSGAPESLTVAWLTPSSDGGGAITGYIATADDGEGGLFTCNTSALTCTISGLTDGVTYSVTVIATNGVGDSTSSSPVSGTPGSVPGAPTDLAVTPGNGSATVSWTAPRFVGGTEITNYTVTADDGDGGLFTCTTSTTTCVVIGLTNGTTYSFTVVATNATGDSDSSTSQSTIPKTNPGAPTDISATPGDGTLTVTFSAPLSSGGSAITGYTVTADDLDGGIVTCQTSKLSCVLTDLTNGVTYIITVVATTDAGDSGNSTPRAATPYTTPASPSSPSVTVGDGTLDVSWIAPVTDGGDAIFRYIATADDGDGGIFTCVTNGTSCIIQGLTNGVTYSITIVATNNAGDSLNSSALTATPTPPVTAPDAPTNVTASVGNATLEVSWSWPQSDGGSAVTSFLVTATDGSGNSYTCLAGPGITSMWTICSISGLSNGVEYTVTVVATNDSGDSAASTAITATPFTTPDAPQQVTATPGVSQVTISWNAPVSDGGSAIVTYTAYAFDQTGDFAGSCSVSSEEFSCTITGLTNFTSYGFSVTATNVAGESNSSVLPTLRNPQAIIEWGSGWLAYDNWDGFISSDATTQDLFSRANSGVTEGWDCAVQFMVAGPNGGVYIQNNCGDMYYFDNFGNYTYIGWNTWGSGYQFAIGPNGQLVFATDDNSLHVYDYGTAQWYVKYIDGSNCINGVTIDRDGTIWISDNCRDDLAALTDNIFDGVDGAWYEASWKAVDLCNPYWLTTDSTGTIYIGNEWCGDNYSTYSNATGPTFVETPGYYPLYVGGLFGQAAPIDFDSWPHRFSSSGVSAMPQSNEPSVPRSAYVYTFGATWIRADWSPSAYQGFGGAITSYRVTATGPEGDAHSCVTNQVGMTNQDSGMYTCVVGGLSPGVSYNLSVRATNAAGDGASTDLGATSTYDPIVTVPTLTGPALNNESTTVTDLSVNGSSISVSDLPPNYMVTVWVTNASLAMSQWRMTSPLLQGTYWGDGGTSVMSFVGDEYGINFDLTHLTIKPNVANQPVTIYAIATPNNIIYNPANGHYYASTLWTTHRNDFAGNLAYASQQNFLGMQGYMATPLTSAELTFLNGFVSNNTFYGGSDDPAFILDPTTGLPVYQYLYANNDSTTASTSDYQSDPNASFQRWYWVSGPHAGEQFANGGQLLYAGGGYANMSVGINGYQSLFCTFEPNDAALTETVMVVAGGCQNDVSPSSWQYTMVEFGGMPGDSVTGTSAVVGSATFSTYTPLPHAPTSLSVSGDEVAGFTLSWTTPDNTASVYLSEYEVLVYRDNGDGTETQVWSTWIGPWATSLAIGGMVFPNAYRVAVIPYGNYGAGPEGSTTFTPSNVHPVGTLNSISVIGNSVAMNYTVSSPYNSWWNYMYFYDDSENYLGNCGFYGNDTFDCSFRNLPTFATIHYDLQIYSPYTGWHSGLSGSFVTGDVARPNNASAVSFTPDYWGGTVSWTLPATNNARYWRVEAWTTEGKGQPYLATASENWDPNGTSMSLNGLNSDHQYQFILYAIDSSSVYSTGLTFAGTSKDPYPAITKASVTVQGNSIVGTWNVTEVYGGAYASRMQIFAMDGTYINTCGDYSGSGDAKSCWTGGLTLATNYYAIIQGYGWQTGWGGGVRVDFTTDDAYVPANFYDATNADGYIYSVAATPDGTVWYYSTTGVHHVVNGIDIVVDVSAYLPANVSLSQVTGLANNGVAFSTNGYDNGWLDTGVLYIAPDGTISYFGDGATNCASRIAPYGDHSVVVSNFYGLTVFDLNTGNYGSLPGLGMYDQMYAHLVASNDGVVYFVDRYNSLLLHRYDGAVEGTPVYTDFVLASSLSEEAVVIDGILYSIDSPAWNNATFMATNLATGEVTMYFNFYGVIETPRLMGFTASGDVLGALNYSSLTFAGQHLTIPLG
jgi:hypothetical protein